MQKKMTKKFWAVLVSLLLITVVGLGGVIAFLSVESNTVTNTFIPGTPNIEVEEDFDTPKTIKENVAVHNSSNFPVYIRTKVIINWADEDGNIKGSTPSTGDYTIDWGSDDWVLHSDGYYYYTRIVDEEGVTKNLIDSCAPNSENVPDGYYLKVDILAESIQAIPDTAVKDAWGVVITEPTETEKGSVAVYTAE